MGAEVSSETMRDVFHWLAAHEGREARIEIGPSDGDTGLLMACHTTLGLVGPTPAGRSSGINVELPQLPLSFLAFPYAGVTDVELGQLSLHVTYHDTILIGIHPVAAGAVEELSRIFGETDSQARD
jgi:hypothetical protein